MTQQRVINLGVVGLDGHGPVFARELNGKSPRVRGMRVAVVMPTPLAMVSAAVLRANTAELRRLGVVVSTTPAELAARVDGILILQDDGSQHLPLVRQFAPFGKPLFVDKPMEVSPRRASQLVAACRAHGCPLFTASALRFTRAVREVRKAGEVCSAMTFSPYAERPTMPGWIYYAIHAVETLFALMGAGCRAVRCVNQASGPTAIGVWRDGRMGIARGIVAGAHDYGFTVWREKETVMRKIDITGIYTGLLQSIRSFVATGCAPVAPEESLEVIAFLEAANRSMGVSGREISLDGDAR